MGQACLGRRDLAQAAGARTRRRRMAIHLPNRRHSEGPSRHPSRRWSSTPQPLTLPTTSTPPPPRAITQTALRRQILAILPEIELFIIAFHCGLDPRSRRTKPALITWLLPHWREAEPHVFAFLDRAKHDSIREAGGVHGRQIDPLADVSLRNSRARSSAYLAAHRPAAGLVLVTPAAGSTPAPPCPMSE